MRGKTPQSEAHPFERGSLSGRAPNARFKREDFELVEGTIVFPFPMHMETQASQGLHLTDKKLQH